MKARSKDLLNRLTGFSTPLFGAQWTSPPSQREIIEELFDRLSDRRVLYSPYEAECPDYCVQSILQIRQIITDLLSKLRGANHASEHLKAIRASCRDFLDKTQRHGGGYHGLGDTMTFNSALGELRGRVGVQIALLSAKHEVEVPDELSAILPPPVDD